MNIRDYGLGSSGKPIGIPKAKLSKIDHPCPNCGCKELMDIEVEIENPFLRGGKGICFYIGCPACPWASPAMTRATGERDGTPESER